MPLSRPCCTVHRERQIELWCLFDFRASLAGPEDHRRGTEADLLLHGGAAPHFLPRAFVGPQHRRPQRRQGEGRGIERGHPPLIAFFPCDNKRSSPGALLLRTNPGPVGRISRVWQAHA